MRFKFLLTHTHTYHSTIFIPKIQRGHHLHFNPLFPYTRNIFLIRPIFIVYSQSPDPTKRFFALQSPLLIPPCTRYIRVTFCSIFIVCSHFSDPVESRINRVTGKDRRCRSPRIEGKGEVRLALVGTHRDY